MSWKPLKHGDRFVMSGADLGLKTVQRFICRTGPMPAKKAIEEGWSYGTACTEEYEGLTWARGWNTKAARALRVAVAL